MKRIIITALAAAAMLVPVAPAQATGLSAHRAKAAMQHYLKHNYGMARARLGSCDSNAWGYRLPAPPDPTIDKNRGDDKPPTVNDPGYFWTADRPDDYSYAEGHWTGTRYNYDTNHADDQPPPYADPTVDPDNTDDLPPHYGESPYNWREQSPGSGFWYSPATSTSYQDPTVDPNYQDNYAPPYTDPTPADDVSVEYQDPTLDPKHNDDHRQGAYRRVPATRWTCTATWFSRYIYYDRTICVLFVCETVGARDEVDCSRDLTATKRGRHVKVRSSRVDCERYEA
jgi:hypothetical protein